MDDVDSTQISIFRLCRHHFLDRRPAQSIEVYSDVCGIQARVSSWAEMALWIRIHEPRANRRRAMGEAYPGHDLFDALDSALDSSTAIHYLRPCAEGKSQSSTHAHHVQIRIGGKDWDELNRAVVDELRGWACGGSEVDRHHFCKKSRAAAQKIVKGSRVCLAS